jgi:hypothetical protein
MSRLRQEDGVTLMELLVAATVGVILSLALFAFLDTTSRSSEQTAARIDAAKLGRPVMASIIDRLHSTCVAPDVQPIRAGSNANTIDFVHQTGSAVTLTPVRRTISWQLNSGSSTEGRLVESIYPVVGGTAPNWTFSSTPSQTRTMLTPVERVGNTIFKYWYYAANGALTQFPAGTTLTADQAAQVVQVGVNFDVPSRVAKDTEGGTTFTDSVYLRFTPAAADADTANLACQ